MTEREDADGRFTPPPRPLVASGFEQPAAPTQRLPPPAAPYDDDLPAAAREEKRRPSAIREIIETLLLAVVIFFLVRAVVLNFRVEGLSMTPNLTNGEMLLVNRNAYANFDLYALVDWLPRVAHAEERTVYPFDPPERGDIVVFNPPIVSDKPYIKRVIGLPGERISIRDGAVYVDGERLAESYLRGEETECADDEACDSILVPDDHLFVLGDNRDNSQDSRGFGPVPLENIIGKAWVTYWPTDDIGIVPHYDYPGVAED